MKKGQIRVKASKDKAMDLPELVRLLEKEIGFSPVTEVEIEVRARVTKRGGRLSLEVTETGQAFEIVGKVKGPAPSEGQTIEARGTLENTRSAKRIKLREWMPAEEGRP